MKQPPFRTRIVFGLLALVAFLVQATAAEHTRVDVAAMQEVPKDRAYELRVLYLEDPRLPTLDSARRRELYGKLEDLLHAWYGYHATLREVGAKDLAGYFAAHADVFRKHRAIVSLRIDPDREYDCDRLRATIERALAPHSLATIQQKLSPVKIASNGQAVVAAYGHFVARLQEIRSLPLPDGSMFADPKRPELNSYMHWCALMHEMEEADVVFTNSMIVGADAEMGLTVVGRGGIMTGNTNANRHNVFGAAVVVGLFPFLSDAPFWLRERGPIPDDERLDAIATMTMHEFGHMLLRRAHPQHSNCVHDPSVGLRYYDWHRAIRTAGPCRLEHLRLAHY